MPLSLLLQVAKSSRWLKSHYSHYYCLKQSQQELQQCTFNRLLAFHTWHVAVNHILHIEQYTEYTFTHIWKHRGVNSASKSPPALPQVRNSAAFKGTGAAGMINLIPELKGDARTKKTKKTKASARLCFLPVFALVSKGTLHTDLRGDVFSKAASNGECQLCRQAHRSKPSKFQSQWHLHSSSTSSALSCVSSPCVCWAGGSSALLLSKTSFNTDPSHF